MRIFNEVPEGYVPVKDSGMASTIMNHYKKGKVQLIDVCLPKGRLFRAVSQEYIDKLLEARQERKERKRQLQKEDSQPKTKLGEAFILLMKQIKDKIEICDARLDTIEDQLNVLVDNNTAIKNWITGGNLDKEEEIKE